MWGLKKVILSMTEIYFQYKRSFSAFDSNLELRPLDLICLADMGEARAAL